MHYFVGGATKLYGAALGRLRPADFGKIVHMDGLSPTWPLSYDEFEPWYAKAEWLYQVRGLHGEDPTEGPWSEEYPWPPVSHEPLVQQIADDLDRAGYDPFHVPRGIMLDEANPPTSLCLRCDTCDGYPCLAHAKADTDVIAVRPLLSRLNVTMLVTEDLPRPGNHVTVDRENHPHLAYVGTNRCEAARLAHEFETMLSHSSLRLARDETVAAMEGTGAGIADQAGTCRFGTDPATSVLDVHCKAHELDNLYVADASFLPSVGAVEPALTVMANAIRVGEHLVRRLG